MIGYKVNNNSQNIVFLVLVVFLIVLFFTTMNRAAKKEVTILVTAVPQDDRALSIAAGFDNHSNKHLLNFKHYTNLTFKV